MMPRLADTSCARLSTEALPRLAPFRALAHLRILVLHDAVWLFWPAGDADLARSLLALDGTQLFTHRDGLWFPSGRHLPSFDVPAEDDARALAGVLSPAPVEPIPATADWQPLGLTLVPCDQPRPCTLLRTTLAELGRFADHATTQQLAALQAAHHRNQVLLRGAKLPPLPGERFWGQRVLLPVAHRTEPDLPEPILAAAMRLDAGELALVTGEGVEVVPQSAFAPLTRAGVRRALQEAPA
jgi:hypothetical protein